MKGLRVHWTRRMFYALLAGVLLLSRASFAQLPTGTISGQVRDASAAAIPGATVTATNRDTGALRTTQSGADGRVTLPAMNVGTYDVKAEAPAFRAEVQQNLTLAVGQEAVLSFA